MSIPHPYRPSNAHPRWGVARACLGLTCYVSLSGCVPQSPAPSSSRNRVQERVSSEPRDEVNANKPKETSPQGHTGEPTSEPMSGSYTEADLNKLTPGEVLFIDLNAEEEASVQETEMSILSAIGNDLCKKLLKKRTSCTPAQTIAASSFESLTCFVTSQDGIETDHCSNLEEMKSAIQRDMSVLASNGSTGEVISRTVGTVPAGAQGNASNGAYCNHVQSPPKIELTISGNVPEHELILELNRAWSSQPFRFDAAGRIDHLSFTPTGQEILTAPPTWLQVGEISMRRRDGGQMPQLGDSRLTVRVGDTTLYEQSEFSPPRSDGRVLLVMDPFALKYVDAEACSTSPYLIGQIKTRHRQNFESALHRQMSHSLLKASDKLDPTKVGDGSQAKQESILKILRHQSLLDLRSNAIAELASTNQRLEETLTADTAVGCHARQPIESIRIQVEATAGLDKMPEASTTPRVHPYSGGYIANGNKIRGSGAAPDGEFELTLTGVGSDGSASRFLNIVAEAGASEGYLFSYTPGQHETLGDIKGIKLRKSSVLYHNTETPCYEVKGFLGGASAWLSGVPTCYLIEVERVRVAGVKIWVNDQVLYKADNLELVFGPEQQYWSSPVRLNAAWRELMTQRDCETIGP